MIAACTETSSAETGSSATITFGSPASARAIATRCFWPPESWWGLRSTNSGGSFTTVEEALRFPARRSPGRDPAGAGAPGRSRSRRCGSGSACCRGSGTPSGAVARRASGRVTRRAPPDLRPAEGRRPGGRRLEPAQHLRERRLAAAGLADDREGLAAAGGQVDVVRAPGPTRRPLRRARGVAGRPSAGRSIREHRARRRRRLGAAAVPSLALAIGAARRRARIGRGARAVTDRRAGNRRGSQRPGSTCTQRAAKTQPRGARRGGATWPGIGTQRAPGACRARGRAGSRAGRACRDGAGSRTPCGSVPSSTSSPAYMTPIRSQTRTTVPRLWLMKRIAASCRCRSVAHEVEDGRLDRDVEAGGRLVHDQERGLGDQGHRDDDALLLAAGELVRIAVEHRLRIGQLHLGEHPRARGARASAAPTPSWSIGTSMSCRPTVMTGLRLAIGSW